MVLIDIEVFNAQLDYNLFLGCSYMYAMQVVTSIIFQLLSLPHDGKIMTINQFTYYDPKGPTTQENFLPTIDNISMPSLSIIGPRIFSNAPFIDTFFSLPPPTLTTNISNLCTITSCKISTSSKPQPQPKP